MPHHTSEGHSTSSDSSFDQLLLTSSNKQGIESSSSQTLHKSGSQAEEQEQDQEQKQEQEQDPRRAIVRTITQTHLESLCLSMIHLVNIHDFTLDSWLNILAPSFHAPPQPPHVPLNATPRQFLTSLSNRYHQHPEFRCCCTDLSSQVEGKTGEVFMNMEVRGVPEGIVTRSCVALNFKLGRKGWRCVGFYGVDGGPGLEGVGV